MKLYDRQPLDRNRYSRRTRNLAKFNYNILLSLLSGHTISPCDTR